MPRYIMKNTLDMIHDTTAQVPKKSASFACMQVHSLLSFCLGQFIVTVQTMAHRPIKKWNRNP